MEIGTRNLDGVEIMDLKGRLAAGESTNELREAFQNAGRDGSKQVILNLKDVDFIDSTGLGVMVIGYTTFKKAGGALKLLNLNRRNIELLVLTKLSTVFEVYGDEMEAINSFFPDRKVTHFDILNFVQEQKEHD